MLKVSNVLQRVGTSRQYLLCSQLGHPECCFALANLGQMHFFHGLGQYLSDLKKSWKFEGGESPNGRTIKSCLQSFPSEPRHLGGRDAIESKTRFCHFRFKWHGVIAFTVVMKKGCLSHPQIFGGSP